MFGTVSADYYAENIQKTQTKTVIKVCEFRNKITDYNMHHKCHIKTIVVRKKIVSQCIIKHLNVLLPAYGNNEAVMEILYHWC
jgi:hypothetical protein